MNDSFHVRDNGNIVGSHSSSMSSQVAFYIDDPHSMSERVQSLADAVYKEFERLIKAYDENAVKDLMPLVVAILESLDGACRDKQQADVDAELLRDDNDQLLSQYEKERQLRRIADQKYLVLEDSMEEERKLLQGRLESFESIIRMFEIKLKNSQDQVSRLEDKEQETKKEFSKLHDRYTDLLKAHMDFKERVKTLVSNNSSSQELVDQSNLNPEFTLPRNFKFSSLLQTMRANPVDVEFNSEGTSPVKQNVKSFVGSDDDDYDDESVGKKITVESKDENDEPGMTADTPVDQEQSAGQKRLITIDERLRKSLIGEMDKLHLTFCEEDGNYESQIRTNMLDELLETEDGAELAMGKVLVVEEKQSLNETDDNDDDDYPGNDHNNFYGVSREIENLIMENNELLETKHALNIVKDDLIAKVDELTGEKEILKDELNSAMQSKERLKARVNELEEVLRRTKDELDREKNKDPLTSGDGEEDGLPAGQKKRFTRLEMARVLMERNQYKEKLMELQEAVRWAEMVRATRDHPEFGGGEKKKSFIWNFFSNLFSPKTNSSYLDCSLPGEQSVYFNAGPGDGLPAAPNNTRSAGLNSILERRRRMEKSSMASNSKDEDRLNACGWSLPPKFQLPRHMMSEPNDIIRNYIPLPVFCKPLLEEDPNIKVLCAAVVKWGGGKTPDGGRVVGTSIFYAGGRVEDGDVQSSSAGSSSGQPDDEIERLNQDIVNQERRMKDVTNFPVGCGADDLDPSHVWVCVDDKTGSHVIVVDVANEGEVLEKFHVCLPNLHCIATIPGATEGKDNQNFATSSLPHYVSLVETNKPESQSSVPSSRSPNDLVSEQVERSLNLLPTVWMGNIAGSLYIYSAVPSSRKRLHIIKLKDSIMAISHIAGRVFVAVANGTVACFLRTPEGRWDVDVYHNIELSLPTCAVRSATLVAERFLWCSVTNDIYVIDPINFIIEKTFNAHPRKENHVRQMACVGDGVWVAFRNDSSLRLYHAYTHQYLQDIDIEPCISKFLGSSKLGFSLVQISCLMTSLDRIWVGTGNGVVLSIPISESNPSSSSLTLTGGHRVPGGVVRVYEGTRDDQIYPGSFVPYCSIGQVQLSFHGHKEAVKFLIAMPAISGGQKKFSVARIGQKHAEIYRKYSLPLPSSASLSLSQSPSSSAVSPLTSETPAQLKCLWVMCGGEGCSDFRLGEDISSDVDGKEHDFGLQDLDAQKMLPKSDKSHIIMWQLLVP